MSTPAINRLADELQPAQAPVDFCLQNSMEEGHAKEDTKSEVPMSRNPWGFLERDSAMNKTFMVF